MSTIRYYQCDPCIEWNHELCERKQQQDEDLCNCNICYSGIVAKSLRGEK